MSTSRTHRLRLSDLRRLYRLVGEIRELRSHPTVQRQRMINGLCELIGAWHGFSVHFAHFTPEQWVQAASVVTGGAPDSRTLKWFAEWAAHNKLNDDPLVDACTRMRRPVGAIRRRDLQAAGLHNGGEIYHGWYEISDLGDSLVSIHHRSGPTDVAGIALHRERNDADFSVRDRKMMRLFMIELYRLYRDGELEAGQGELLLPPRQQQVLERLLHGHSAKQIAAAMGLSQRTVEEYARGLYEKFGVTTRAELMARFLRQLPSTSAERQV